MIELQELTFAEQAANGEVRERARTSSKRPCTRHYSVLVNDEEVGFVALDIVPGIECLILYEIFVPKGMRRNGLGSRLLIRVESLAREMGYPKISLTPWPLEPCFPESQLIRLACCRFRRHRVRCHDGTGGVSWRDGSLHGSSSLRRCG
jgi:GNAT superfamily N-acetyltransferase